MKKRILIGSFIVMLMVSMLVPPTFAEKAVIRFINAADIEPGDFIAVTNEFIKEFEAENPNIQVKFQPLMDYDTYVNKITTQMAAGDAPDIFIAWGDFFYNWMELGQTLPLEDYVSKELLEDLWPAQLRMFYIGGHLAGLPLYANDMAMYYNEDMFDEAGLAYPDKSWDWDILRDNAIKLTKKDTSGKIVQYGLMTRGNNMLRLTQWIWQNGGEIADKELGATKLLLDQPKALEGLKFTYDLMWKDEVVPLPFRMPAGQSVNKSFIAGLAAMSYDGNTVVPQVVETVKFNWNIAPLPKGPAGRATWVSTDGLAIYRRTKHPEAAVKFLKALYGRHYQEDVSIKKMGNLSCLVSLADKFQESPGGKAGIDLSGFIDAMKEGYARPAPLFVDQGEVKQMYDSVFEAIFLTGSTPLEQGIRELCTNVNKVIERYLAEK